MVLKKAFYIFIIAVLTLWVSGLIAFIAVVTKPDFDSIPSADAIVVLTGGPGRISYGLELFADGKAPDLFVSGVYKGVEMDDIRKQTDRVLPDCCITLGYEATTTIENANEIKKWLSGTEVRSIILVTSNYHMPRALLELRRLREENGLVIYPAPITPFVGTHRRWDYIKLSLSEYHKAFYRMASLRFSRLFD